MSIFSWLHLYFWVVFLVFLFPRIFSHSLLLSDSVSCSRSILQLKFWFRFRPFVIHISLCCLTRLHDSTGLDALKLEKYVIAALKKAVKDALDIPRDLITVEEKRQHILDMVPLIVDEVKDRLEDFMRKRIVDQVDALKNIVSSRYEFTCWLWIPLSCNLNAG